MFTGRKAEGKRKSSVEAWKCCIPGGYEQWLSLLPLLALEYGNGKGEHWGMRMNMSGDVWKDARSTSFWLIYTPGSTVTRVPVVS